MNIIINNVVFSYNPKDKHPDYTLSNVSLSINQGEFFGIIGQTGSGKSTLIQHLNALLPLQGGQILMGDTDLDAKAKGYKKQLKNLRAKVGMVFQYPEYQLFAETVFADVAFGLKNFFPELNQEEVKARVYAAIRAVGLDYNAVCDKSPFELSGGQRRRVAIAGVLVTNPEVLVLDEPVAGLDPIGKKELMDLLHAYNKGNKTVIIVSHDMDEVCENCTRIAVMSEGKIVRQGTPEEVFSGDETEKLRLGTPVTARLKRHLAQKGIEIAGSLKTEEFIFETVKALKEAKKQP